MTIAVTGAAGFVGGNVIRALLETGRPLRGLVFTEADRQRLADLPVEQVYGDVTKLDTLQTAFQGAEVVYHLASLITLVKTDLPLAEAMNVQGAANVVQACVDQGVRRLVHFSSFHALDQEPLDQPLDETSPLVASDHPYLYSRTKAAGERLVLEGLKRGLEVVVIRPTGIIGIHDYQPSLFGATLLDLAKGRLPGLVRGGCNWVDVRDVATGAVAAEQKAASGSIYMLSGHYASITKIAQLVAEVSGTPPPRFVTPLWLAKTLAPLSVRWSQLVGARPRFTPDSIDVIQSNPQISHAKAAKELGYQPRPLETTVRDAVTWLLEHYH